MQSSQERNSTSGDDADSQSSTSNPSELKGDHDLYEDCSSDNPKSSTSDVPNRKRTFPHNTVPTFIDNKRKNMERQLSGTQRDKLLLQEEKEKKRI